MCCTLSLAALCLVAADALFQLSWYKPYFSFGIPIFTCQSDDAKQLVATLSEAKISLHYYADTPNLIAVRQQYFGIARYAYFHGQIRLAPNGKDGRLTIYADYNIFAIGAFMAVATTNSEVMAILGAMVAWTVASAICAQTGIGRKLRERKSNEHPGTGHG